MWYSNMWAESFKIYLRCFYCMIAWYEPLYQYYLGQFDESWVHTDKEWDE